jgi:hypothetical protein
MHLHLQRLQPLRVTCSSRSGSTRKGTFKTQQDGRKTSWLPCAAAKAALLACWCSMLPAQASADNV